MKDPRQFRKLTLWIVLLFGIVIPLGSIAGCAALGGGVGGKQSVNDVTNLVGLGSAGIALIELTGWILAEVAYLIWKRFSYMEPIASLRWKLLGTIIFLWGFTVKRQ